LIFFSYLATLLKKLISKIHLSIKEKQVLDRGNYFIV